jgi:hypothetical protein
MSMQDSRWNTTTCKYSHPKILGRRNDRSLSFPKQRLPVKIFYFTGKNKTSPDLRLSQTKQFHPSRTFQDGRGTCTSRNNRRKRLYLQNRLERCLRCCTYSPRLKELSQLREPRNCLPLQIPGIRTKCCPTYLLKNHEICNRTITERRTSFSLLLRRHLFARKIKRKNETANYSGHKTSSRSRLYYQLQQKHVEPSQDTGISRFPVQYEKDGNFSTKSKDKQPIKEDQTSGYHISKILPMDSKHVGKDDLNDSSNRGSLATYQIHSKGLIKSTTHVKPELGNNLQVVVYKHPRTRMVEKIYNQKEWASNSEDNTEDSEGHNTRRRFKYRLENQLSTSHNFRILDQRRNSTINKRKRTQDDIICNTTPRKKLRRVNNKDIFRQHHSFEIYNKIGGYDIVKSSGFSYTDTKPMQRLQHSGNLSTHPRGTEYTSRQVEQSKETTVRISNPKNNVQTDQSAMGTFTSGCVRSEAQQTTAALLGNEYGPRSSSNRRFPTELADQGALSISAMENDSKGIKTNKIAEVEESNPGDTAMAESILVSYDSTNETHRTTNNMANKRKMVLSRMAIIDDYRKKKGIEKQTIQFLKQRTRESTQRTYDNGWNQWASWCNSNNTDPCQYNPHNVLAFLVANQQYSNTHLNTLRSAIASVFSVIHESEKPIADQQLVKEFFSAKRRSNVQIPTTQQLFTWDLTILLRYVKGQLSPTNNIPLHQLQIKTILLLCMATMWRPRSDIGRLQHRDIHINTEKTGSFHATIHARTPKEGQVKSIIIGEYIDEQLCPVKTLIGFLQKNNQVS